MRSFLSRYGCVRQFTFTHWWSTWMHVNVTVVDVSVVVYNKTWENAGYAVSSWSASTGYLASMLTEVTKVEHPRSTSLPNIQCYLIMNQWITLQYTSRSILKQYTVYRQQTGSSYSSCWLVSYMNIHIKSYMQVFEWLYSLKTVWTRKSFMIEWVVFCTIIRLEQLSLHHNQTAHLVVL